MRKLSLFLTIALAALASAACNKNLGNDPEDPQIPELKAIRLSAAQTKVLDAGKDFNFELLKKVATGDKSVFLSPLSLQTALSMAANGATGTTFTEIAETIGYKGCSIEEINSMYRQLIAGLSTVDTSTTLENANSAWTNSGFPIYKDYISTLKDVFQAECSSLDFSAPSALSTINGWCSDKTHGMIPSLYEKIEPDYQFILLNALYFKGIWVKPFDTKKTHDYPFQAIDGSKKTVQMMHQTESFRYGKSEQAQICMLPFGNKAYELDIILPNTGIDFKKYVSLFDYSKLIELMSSSCYEEVILAIPKIELDCFTPLVDILKDMGINVAFTDFAQFPGTSEVPLKIADVRQRAAFKMDEKGAKAAAVTGIADEKATSIGTDEPIVFTADHPFILLIRECTSSAILFVGTYTGK